MKLVNQKVHPNPGGYLLPGNYRIGAVNCTLEEFESVFGECHEHDPSGDKSTKFWYFETPRGRICICNYWSNPRNELSILGTNSHAIKWIVPYLRSCKLTTTKKDENE